MNALGLKALLGEDAANTFMKESWPQKPFAAHERKTTLLSEAPFLESLEALLKIWPREVQVHLPDVSDESSSIHAKPQDAKKLFANKMALLFNKVHEISEPLQKRLHAIHEDLGLPRSTFARCMVYATPDGRGTAAHFDQNVNFVVQLHGTKTWWLAPNASVENPLERHTIGGDLDPELATYLHAEMPSSMPDGAEKFVLNPGSVLFVPRGWWHRTEATGEALALNFTFSQPTWIDLFTLALKSRLSLSPEWRELADGVTSKDENRRQEAEERFDMLLAELVYDLPNWRAQDILGATEG